MKKLLILLLSLCAAFCFFAACTGGDGGDAEATPSPGSSGEAGIRGDDTIPPAEHIAAEVGYPFEIPRLVGVSGEAGVTVMDAEGQTLELDRYGRVLFTKVGTYTALYAVDGGTIEKTITVTDTKPPRFAATDPAKTVVLGERYSLQNIFSAADNSGEQPTLTYTVEHLGAFPVELDEDLSFVAKAGFYQIACRAEDRAGNFITRSFRLDTQGFGPIPGRRENEVESFDNENSLLNVSSSNSAVEMGFSLSSAITKTGSGFSLKADVEALNFTGRFTLSFPGVTDFSNVKKLSYWVYQTGPADMRGTGMPMLVGDENLENGGHIWDTVAPDEWYRVTYTQEQLLEILSAQKQDAKNVKSLSFYLYNNGMSWDENGKWGSWEAAGVRYTVYLDEIEVETIDYGEIGLAGRTLTIAKAPGVRYDLYANGTLLQQDAAASVDLSRLITATGDYSLCVKYTEGGAEKTSNTLVYKTGPIGANEINSFDSTSVVPQCLQSTVDGGFSSAIRRGDTGNSWKTRYGGLYGRVRLDMTGLENVTSFSYYLYLDSGSFQKNGAAITAPALPVGDPKEYVLLVPESEYWSYTVGEIVYDSWIKVTVTRVKAGSAQDNGVPVLDLIGYNDWARWGNPDSTPDDWYAWTGYSYDIYLDDIMIETRAE